MFLRKSNPRRLHTFYRLQTIIILDDVLTFVAGSVNLSALVIDRRLCLVKWKQQGEKGSAPSFPYLCVHALSAVESKDSVWHTHPNVGTAPSPQLAFLYPWTLWNWVQSYALRRCYLNTSIWSLPLLEFCQLHLILSNNHLKTIYNIIPSSVFCRYLQCLFFIWYLNTSLFLSQGRHKLNF